MHALPLRNAAMPRRSSGRRRSVVSPLRLVQRALERDGDVLKFKQTGEGPEPPPPFLSLLTTEAIGQCHRAPCRALVPAIIVHPFPATVGAGVRHALTRRPIPPA